MAAFLEATGVTYRNSARPAVCQRSKRGNARAANPSVIAAPVTRGKRELTRGSVLRMATDKPGRVHKPTTFCRFLFKDYQQECDRRNES